jgi:4-amino-4-deoxy-L-arabinose transferase-like glycosyltransferase
MRPAVRPGAGLAAGPAPVRIGLPPRHALAAVLAGAGAACAGASLELDRILSGFDTLAYLLEPALAGRRAAVAAILLGAGAGLAALAVTAFRSPRLAVTLCGVALAAAGLAAIPAGRSLLDAGNGLPESLLYRLRGCAAGSTLAGVFLVCLASLPRVLRAPPGRVERRVGEALAGLARAVERVPAWRIRLGIAAAGFAAVLAVGFGVLADFPNSSDEASYVTQARVFATGRLALEMPPAAEFFRARSFVWDVEGGRIVSKGFPGYPAILAAGFAAGVPWIVNPLLSAATLALLGWIAAERLGRRGEPLAVALVAATPFFLLNSASYFSHAAALFLLTLFLAALLRWERGGRSGWCWALLAGSAAGAAFAVRPASAAALTVPFLGWTLYRRVRGGRWREAVALASPVVLAASAIAAYHRHLFGSALTTGYAAADPGDIRLGFGADHWLMTGWWLFKLLLWTVPGSLAGLYFLLRARGGPDPRRADPVAGLLGVSLALLVVLHLLFQDRGGNEYGPRYYYDGFTYLALLLAEGWRRAPGVLGAARGEAWGRRAVAWVLGAGILISACGSIPALLLHYRDKVAHNRDLEVTVARAGLGSALVFLRTGSGRLPPGDLLRNPPDFRTGVVFARDLGAEKNRSLAALYSDRPAFVYSYDPAARRSTLVPFSQEESR